MAKKKKKHWFRWYYIIPLILLAVICVFIYVLFGGSTKSDQPVYGRRCEVVQEITDEQVQAANNAIQGVEGLVSSSLELNCLTFDMTLTVNESVSITDAEAIATSLTHIVDQTLGFEKYKESDSYSKIFSNNEFDHMYDFKITIYNSANTYTIYGTKQYQNEEVVYTDSNAKDQSLVDNLHAAQSTPVETTTEQSGEATTEAAQ